jgi:mannose-6-phosphate isomerase-like protein (cupin superfamily)
VITKFRVEESAGASEFGMTCQRLVPWLQDTEKSPPFGVMACFLAPSQSSDPDCHNQDEVMIVVSGRGEVHIGGEKEVVETSDFIVIPRNQEHVVSNPNTETLTWISCYWPLREPAQEVAR